MLSLEEMKKYLRVDFIDDDDFITELILFSAEYLTNAGIVASISSSYKLAQKIIVDDRYNHRGSEEVTPKGKSSLNSIILQLQNIVVHEVVI